MSTINLLTKFENIDTCPFLEYNYAHSLAMIETSTLNCFYRELMVGVNQ